uniref:hypothetical protein n=1 Tax=Marinobacterium profundum TaxID=1714300 RepID=UPI0013158C18|nr:hypothetical protein [Marinobacterium profundum]
MAIASSIVVIVGVVIAWSKQVQKPEKEDASSDILAERFIALFEAHGVHRNQIPGFFGKGISLADVSSPESLLSKLSPELLSDAAELFAVNLEWLQGSIDSPYPTHQFYKQPDEFERFIDELISRGNSLDGYVFNAILPGHVPDEYDAAIVLTEEIGHVNDRPVFRVHICNGWVFRYWKCRGYLAACIATAWRKGVRLIGKQVTSDWLVKFGGGNELIEYDYDVGYLNYPACSTWYADELVECPEKFLYGVDPEQNKFGLQAALGLWLELDNEGYMQMYADGTHTAVRAGYTKALSDLYGP